MTKPKRQTLTERRAEELRMTIALTARDLFVAEGDASATVERICEIVGIAPRTFHRHFPVKEDVLMPLLRRSETIILGELENAPGDADPVEILTYALTLEVGSRQVPDFDRQLVRLIVNTPQYRLRFVEWSEGLADGITKFLSRYYELDAEPFLRDLPARLVVQTMRHAIYHWVDASGSGDYSEVGRLEFRGFGMALSGLERLPQR
ncbi:TetR/AcrR family transcriptional regulator [Nocardia miyunensis]|uniref:TetR/AcrR family transcriptional regulator n=1 Tax=Nocardia miyunensis TaxID=282684 RepID=UPI00082C6224|nr:TetR/AcrR family transcriptional regulator [Nocardia miyunensis]